MTIVTSQSQSIPAGALCRLHHIALNVAHMPASRHFYGTILGLHELTGSDIPSSLIELVKQGRVTNFRLPDGTILDLFDLAVRVLRDNDVPIEGEPVTRSTGKGIYCYDPDGFMVEIRCD